MQGDPRTQASRAQISSRRESNPDVRDGIPVRLSKGGRGEKSLETEPHPICPRATNGGVDRATQLWFPCSSARCVASVQRMVLSSSEAAPYRRNATIGLYRMLGPHCNLSPGFVSEYVPPTMWPKSNAEAGPSHVFQWQQVIRASGRPHSISLATVQRENARPKPTCCRRPQDLPTHSIGRSLHRHATIEHCNDRTVRVTRYARKILNFRTAQLAYSGARDGYPPFSILAGVL
ncbi:hypothetical protein Pla52n_44160 [Stieleria varia]|uniref:Uncharacterized protein n=1 Tax=Stieleria varia TaxID=2528005 RepID=A0A5C6AM03_9BACT|nr:hypothetical protein Pla52n_44160 [Stieleria varia]